jgi:hypothetical protein
MQRFLLSSQLKPAQTKTEPHTHKSRKPSIPMFVLLAAAAVVAVAKLLAGRERWEKKL